MGTRDGFACYKNGKNGIWTAGIAVGMAALTFLAMKAAIRADVERRVMREGDSIEAAIVYRLDGFEAFLRDTRAALLSAHPPTYQLFRDFVENSGVMMSAPEILGVGLYESLAWEREVVSSLTYQVPADFRNRSAGGADLLSDPRQRGFITELLRTGNPVLAGPFVGKGRVSRETPTMVLYFSMDEGSYLPVARPGSRWLGLEFRALDLFRGIFGEPSLGHEKLDWRLVSLPYLESAGEDVIYDRFEATALEQVAAVKVERKLTIFGRPFQLTLTPMRGFLSATDRFLPPGVAFLSGCLTFAVGFAVRRIRRQSERAREVSDAIAVKQQLIAEQEAQLELLHRFSRAVVEEMSEEALFRHLLTTIREAKIDFAYLYVPDSSSGADLKLQSWLGLSDVAGIPDRLSPAFVRQIMSNRYVLAKDHRIMGPSLIRLLGPRAKSQDWTVALVQTQQRANQALLVAGNESARFSKLQRELLDNVISYVGLGIDKIALIDRAQTSSRSKAAFLANMSHEIRTPLNALMGFSEMLTGARLTDMRRISIASSIRRNSEYLTSLIDDILDLSKIEAGKLKIHHRRVRLAGLVHEIKSVIDLKVREKALEFEVVAISPLPIHIFIDDVRLKQILLNIVGNAVKFTSHGSVTMSLSCKKRGGSSGDLTFYIEDTGAGISEDAKFNLFKPFSQGDETTTRKFGGSGLGLALSSRLAAELGGSLKLIRSALDVGSVFEITVPTGDLSGSEWSDKLDPPAAVPVPSRAGYRKLDGLRVLLVEDSADNQEIFSFFLQNAGAEVKTVDNGKDAVDLALRCSFDLILMDIQLPGMDGKEATQRLRAQGCRTTILALTAHAMREEKDSCIQAGCDGQITKPISERDFLAAVYSLLSLRSNRTPPRVEVGPGPA